METGNLKPHTIGLPARFHSRVKGLVVCQCNTWSVGPSTGNRGPFQDTTKPWPFPYFLSLLSHVIPSNFFPYISFPVFTTCRLCAVTHSPVPEGPWNGPFPLPLSCCPYLSWPSGTPPLSYWLPGLTQSRPYSPLVRSRFLPWLTDSYISNRFHVRSLLIALMMEAARTSETLVNFYQTTRCCNPEDSHLRTHRRENLKSYSTEVVFNADLTEDAVLLLQLLQIRPCGLLQFRINFWNYESY
jgi:hypothetical protein